MVRVVVVFCNCLLVLCGISLHNDNNRVDMDSDLTFFLRSNNFKSKARTRAEFTYVPHTFLLFYGEWNFTAVLKNIKKFILMPSRLPPLFLSSFVNMHIYCIIIFQHYKNFLVQTSIYCVKWEIVSHPQTYKKPQIMYWIFFFLSGGWCGWSCLPFSAFPKSRQ